MLDTILSIQRIRIISLVNVFENIVINILVTLTWNIFNLFFKGFMWAIYCGLQTFRGIVFNDPPTTEIAPTTLELEEGLPRKKKSLISSLWWRKFWKWWSLGVVGKVCALLVFLERYISTYVMIFLFSCLILWGIEKF